MSSPPRRINPETGNLEIDPTKMEAFREAERLRNEEQKRLRSTFQPIAPTGNPTQAQINQQQASNMSLEDI